MTASPSTKSTTSTGNIRVWWVPGTTASGISVAALTAGTTKDVTTSFTGSGLTPTINENSIPDSRLGIRQILNKRGNFSEELAMEYVYGDTADVAQPAMTEGTVGQLVVRRGVDNAIEPTIAQKVTIYTGECGKQMQQPPAENSIDTIKQSLFLNAPTQNLVALTA